MARNFDRFDRLRQRAERWNEDRRFSFFHELRRRLYRSRDGKVLGVFRGIAESMGFCVFWTRVIGCVILLTLTDFFGAHGLIVTLLVGGFFYLLAALLMQAPRGPGGLPVPADDPSGAGRKSAPHAAHALCEDHSRVGALPSTCARAPGWTSRNWTGNSTASTTASSAWRAIVTDRQYDWERRLES